MSKCAKCGIAEAAWEWPCLQIDQSVSEELVNWSSSGQTYKRTTSQSIQNVHSAGLCPECEKQFILPKYNKLPGYVIVSIIVTVILAIGCVSAGLNSDSEAPTLPPGTIFLLAVAAAAVTLVLWFLRRKQVNRILAEKLGEPLEKRCLVLGQVKEEITEKSKPRYVPLGDGFYPDKDTLMKVNPHLVPDMYTHLYEKVISGDQWKALNLPEPKRPR